MLSACAGEEAGPAEVLQRFVDLAEAPGGRGMAEAYVLLAPESQERLRERASQAQTLSQRPLRPWEVLAPGSFALRHPIERIAVEQEGDNATLTVSGGGDESTVRAVKVDGAWRLLL